MGLPKMSLNNFRMVSIRDCELRNWVTVPAGVTKTMASGAQTLGQVVLAAVVPTVQETLAVVQVGQEALAVVQVGQEALAAVQVDQEALAAVQVDQEALAAVQVDQEALVAVQVPQAVVLVVAAENNNLSQCHLCKPNIRQKTL